VDVALLAGGIWEALVTTAFGLAVAIPALAAVNWLEGIVERVRQDMGDAVTRTLSAMRRAG
jgi:biopolymer transport protein ExbB